MTAASLFAIVLTCLGAVPGEDTGWGTGEVEFVARVSTDEHQEIYPICAGRYTVELVIMEVISDREGVLEYKTRMDVCYDEQLGLASGDTVEVTGTYHDGACPLPYCGRVEARYVVKIDDREDPDDDDDDDDDEEPEILSPNVITGAVEATETSVTMQGHILNDGGESCRVRFIYRTEDGRSWKTEWQTGINTGGSFSQRVEGLIPGTFYVCWIEAENSAGWDFGREAGFRTLPEKVPPIPHPAVWAAEPDPVDTASVTMMADVVRDLSGPQEYAFDFVSSPTGGAGGTNSAWQFSPVYVDVGLNPNHQYGYRIQARDGNGNETAFSPVRYAYTAIETPAGVAFGPITTNSIQAKASGHLSGLALGQSGLKLENVTAFQVSEWQHENVFWTSAGLLPNTRYSFRAQARNGDGVPTGFSPELPIYTLAMVPGTPTFSHPTTSQLLVHWNASGNPAGTLYWCQNTITKADSGWAAATRWPDAGLSPNAKYTYQVKARNGDGVETVLSASAGAYSAIETPTGVAFGPITTNSIQAKAAGTLSNLSAGQSGLRLENATVGNVSEWQHDNTLWTSEGLLPNSRYSFRAQARNGDGEPTDFGPEVAIYTQAMVPAAMTFSDPAVDRLQVQWSANGNPMGTQYWCQNTVTKANSGWTASVRWPDAGLSPNVRYTYQVKARNQDGLETALSASAGAYSGIETPTGVAFGPITTNSIQAKAGGTLSNLSAGQSGLRLENTTAGKYSDWQHDNTLWTSDALLPNTRYSFRAQARNGDGAPTGFGPEAAVYTQAMVPTAATISNVATNQLQVQWGANGNPSGTQYWCQNMVTNANSGWTVGMHWPDAGLSPNVKYAYQVKARNEDGVETAFSTLAAAYSAIETPNGIVFGIITPTSIQVSSRNTPSNLDRVQSGLWFENVSQGKTSSWRHDNTPWTSDGLLPNRSYSFRARARNGDGVQTPYCTVASIYTYANAPAAGTFGGITTTSIQVQWGANGNPAGTQYLCENTTAGVHSGWITDATWENAGLMPSTSYAFRVKARNADGIETAWTSLGSESTEYRSLKITSTPGGKVSSPAQEVTRYAPGTTVNLIATAQPGYHFLEWTGTAVDAGRVADPIAAQTTVVVDAHYTLVANFLRTRMYVDKRATGAKNGSSWKNAFVSLQDALAAAQRGNEICVAKGVYTPDVGAGLQLGDRFATFEIPSGVAVKGGFAGNAGPDPNQRNIVANETILSGDLVGDDRPILEVHDLYNPARRADNSLHVVAMFNAADTTLLEGFTITGGNGIDGAGLCLIRSDPVIARCIISTNRAGQLSGDGAEGWGQGAGVSCYLCKPTFSACVFYANWAGGQGGGLYNVESSPTLKECVFKNNEAGLQGGAIYGQDSISASVDCTFHANWAGAGGALYDDDGSSTRLTNCRFFGNGAHDSGGALYDVGAGLEIINGVFTGNMAYVDGGAIVAQGPALITNCTFHRNLAQGKQSGQSLTVRNAAAALANCILWNWADTSKNQIAVAGLQDSPAALTVSYCDLLGGAEMIAQKANATITWGPKNLNVDPKFQDPAGADGVIGTEDDDLRLQGSSPCIDAGDNCDVPADVDDLNANGDRQERIPFDLDAQPRFVDDPATANTGNADLPKYPAIVDLGAYEL